jgi:hypothetical protein
MHRHQRFRIKKTRNANEVDSNHLGQALLEKKKWRRKGTRRKEGKAKGKRKKGKTKERISI